MSGSCHRDDRYECSCSLRTFLSVEEIRLVERHRTRKRRARLKAEAPKRARLNELLREVQALESELARG